MPRIKLIYHGNDTWKPPTQKFGECEHLNRRFDPRFGLPTSTYCLDCGEAYIHPWHGYTEEEIEDIKRRAHETYKWIWGEES